MATWSNMNYGIMYSVSERKIMLSSGQYRPGGSITPMNKNFLSKNDNSI